MLCQFESFHPAHILVNNGVLNEDICGINCSIINDCELTMRVIYSCQKCCDDMNTYFVYSELYIKELALY